MNAAARSALVALLAPAAAAQIPELHWVRSPDSGQWYGFTPTSTTWADGEALGVANGGHLATIRTAAENSWFAGVLDALGSAHAWIGLNDVGAEGAFAWTSGLPLTHTAWSAGEPSAASPEHDVVIARSQVLGATWFVQPTSHTGYRPAIESASIPPAGWRLPDSVALPFQNPGWPELGDVDGDGLLDAVVPSRESSGPAFAVARGAAGGTFAPGQGFGGSSGGFYAAVADFDGDGRDDVAVTLNGSQPPVRVHYAGAQVDFARTWEVALAGEARDVAGGDLDGDGRADLLVARSGGIGVYELALYRADAAGDFQAPLTHALAALPREILVADVDADLDLDWLVSIAGEHVTVFQNDGTATAPVVTTVPVTAGGQSMALADFDGDGILDLAMSSASVPGVRVQWGDGAGGFDVGGPVVLQLGAGSQVTSADFDGDGRPDLCGASANTDEIRVVRSTPGGGFTLTTSLFGGDTPRGARVADLDGDGRPEIVWVTNASSGLPAARVNWVRRFATDCDADGVDDTTEIRDDAGLDVDGDGRLDACASAGTTFCAGDGTATACPCGNASAPGAGEGCLHSLGTGGRLDALGTPSLAADDVRLLGSRLPNSSALYFQGMNEFAGGAGVVFGDGLRCAGGAVLRIVTRTNAGGASRYPEAGEPPLATRGGVAAPGARTYQVWFRNAAAFCTAFTFNLTGGVRIDWVP